MRNPSSPHSECCSINVDQNVDQFLNLSIPNGKSSSENSIAHFYQQRDVKQKINIA